jgi:hypothetical protein
MGRKREEREGWTKTEKDEEQQPVKKYLPPHRGNARISHTHTQVVTVSPIFTHTSLQEDAKRIPTRPVSSVNVRRRSNPAAPLRPATIQTRVFKQELPLQGIPPDYKSTLSVECYFRTWEGDVKERDPKIRALTHSDLLVLPPLKQLFKEKNATCLCYSVFSLERTALESLKVRLEIYTRFFVCYMSLPGLTFGAFSFLENFLGTPVVPREGGDQ